MQDCVCLFEKLSIISSSSSASLIPTARWQHVLNEYKDRNKAIEMDFNSWKAIDN
jgi:hypothetical protein